MQMYRAQDFLFMVLLCSCQILFGITIGSNTAVSRQAQVTFPASDTNNQVLGFAMLEGGLVLQDATTTCSLNGAMPIAGDICLEGGTCYLLRDLKLSNTGVLFSSGIIQSNFRSLEYAADSSEIQFPEGRRLRLIDSEPLAADGRSVAWSHDDRYLAVGTSSQTGTELKIYHFNGLILTLTLQQELADHCYSVDWHPSQYDLAVGRDSNTGQELRVYRLNVAAGTFIQTDGREIGANVVGVQWDSAGDFLLSARVSTTQFVVYPYTTSTGLLGSDINISFSPNKSVQERAIDWHKSGNFFAAGTASGTGPELMVFGFNGSSGYLHASLDINQTVRAVNWSEDLLVAGFAGGSDRLRLYDFSAFSSALSEVTTARVGESATVLGANWHPTGNYLLVSYPTLASGEVKLFSFDSQEESLRLRRSIVVGNTVNQVAWSHSGSYLAYVSNNDTVVVYGFLPGFVRIINTQLSLNTDTVVQEPLFFRGNCVVEGNNNAIDVTQSSGITVDSGACLTLRNIILKGLSGSKLLCAGPTSKIIFDNVELQLDDALSFTQGSFECVRDVIISGSTQFEYASSSVSTIQADSALIVNEGATLYYNPPTANKSLLAMADETAQLCLCGATLRSTATGIQLTRGTLIVDGMCTIESQATVAAEAVQFGNGISATNDLTVKILPNSGIDVISGFLRYQNIS